MIPALHPVLSDRPINLPDRPASNGSVLGKIVAASVEHADFFEVDGFDALPVHQHFTEPRYSAELLSRLNFRNNFQDCRHGLVLEQCATCAKLSQSGKSKPCLNARTFSFRYA